MFQEEGIYVCYTVCIMLFVFIMKTVICSTCVQYKFTHGDNKVCLTVEDCIV